MTALASIAALLPPILVAYIALRAAGLSESGTTGRVLDLSLAVGSGLGSSSALYFLWLLLFDGSGTVVAAELVAMALVTVMWVRRMRQAGRLPDEHHVGEGGELGEIALADEEQAGSRGQALGAVELPQQPGARATGYTIATNRRWVRPALIASFCVTLVFSALAFAARSAARPHGGWDARLIWNLRARFLFRGGADWPAAFSDLFGQWTPTDYPLLIPGSVARAWSVAGAETPLVPIAVAALFALATLGLLVAAVTRLRGLDQGLLAGIVLLGSRGLARQGATQYADVPLGFFILATLVAVTLWLQADRDGSRRALGVAGLSAGLAAWTKNEGLLFLPVLIVALGLASARQLRPSRAARDALAFLAGLLPVLAVVVGFKWFVGSTSSNYLVAAVTSGEGLEYLGDARRYTLVAGSFATDFDRLGGWLISLPLVLAGYLLVVGPAPAGRLRRALAFGSANLVLLLAGYFAVYILTPRDLAWHLQVTLYRLVLHVWPGMLFLFFVAARVPWQPAEPAPAASASLVRGPAG